MSVQTRFASDGHAALFAETERRRASLASREALVANLSGGLRATYRAEPEADLPDAFAELIAKLRKAEDRAA